MENRQAVLDASDIKKSFMLEERKIDVLGGISFSAKAGEITGIIGASGTGKSTLLHVLGGLDKPDSGKVLIDGDNFFELSDETRSAIRGRKIGFVFQFHHLLPEFSAKENVLLPTMIAGSDPKKSDEKAETLFEMVGLSERGTHRPGKLSGGEQQRTAIVRALINSPMVLLADEPTGNLDEKSAEDVFALIKEITKKESLATVIVTHNLKLAKQMDMVYELHAGLLEKKEP